MTGRTVLPLRILDGPDGLVIAGLCGAEAAITTAPELHPGIGRAAADASPAAVVRMAMHARSCRECQYRQLEISKSKNVS